MSTADRGPRGLKARGGRFWKSVTAGYELNVDELELLLEVARCLDVCEDLAGAVEGDGLTVAGSVGQPRLHPAVGELRATRALVGRLLAQLGLPDADGQTLDSPVRARARGAANKRWAATRGDHGAA